MDQFTETSPLWTPANLATPPWFWYKMNEISGSDGDTVSSLTDASGNGRNTTNTVGTPNLEVAEQNGLNAVHFDGVGAGSGEWYGLVDMSSLTAGYCCMALRTNYTGAAIGAPIECGNAGNTSYHPFTDGKVYDSYGCQDRKDTITPLVDLNTWHCSELSSKTAEWKWLQNAQVCRSTSTVTVGFWVLTLTWLGRSTNSTMFNGWMGEVIQLSYVPTDSERKLLQGYIANKWGFQADLPNGHPYQSSPPHVGDTP